MENRPDLKFRNLHEDIKRHFDFLFRRGYRIAAAIILDEDAENWEVTLIKKDRLIKIYNLTRGTKIAVSTLQLYDDIGYFDLSGMIHFVSKGRRLHRQADNNSPSEKRQLERLADLLRAHLDNIFAQLEAKERPPNPTIRWLPFNSPYRQKRAINI